MGQDPNQPYPGQYGQPGGVPPQPSEYQSGYQQPAPAPAYQPNSDYQQPAPGAPGYQPNPGYQYQQQQTYGQPAPLYNTANPNGPTSINMEPNVAAGLSYLFGWIGGLIFFLIEKQNRYVRFNAMQSILLTVAFVAAYIVATIILAIPFIGLIGIVLFPLLWLAGFVLFIVCLIMGFQGKYFKLPLIGDYAERWANPNVPVMPMR